MLSLLFASTAMAAPEGADVAFKLLQGTVSAVSAQGIAVEYEQTGTRSSEMYLPFDPQMKWRGVRSPKELRVGDGVLVEYRETLLKDAQGKPTRPSRVAVRVDLVRLAPTVVPAEEPASEEASEEAEDVEPATP